MEPEYSNEPHPERVNEIMKLKHQIRELKAENVVLRAKMEHARAILKSDPVAQEETKRLFNPSGLWDKYANSKANY